MTPLRCLFSIMIVEKRGTVKYRDHSAFMNIKGSLHCDIFLMNLEMFVSVTLIIIIFDCCTSSNFLSFVTTETAF